MGLFNWGAGGNAAPDTTAVTPATQAQVIPGQGDGGVPGTSTQTPATESPLDSVAKFLTGGNVAPDINQRTTEMFSMDPAKFDAQFDKTYLKLSDEQLTAMKAGGDEGLRATLQVINDTVRESMKEAARNSVTITQHGLRSSDGYIGERVENTLARRTAADAVYDMGEQMSHPAMKAIADPLIAGLARDYPNATKAQLTEHAQGMMEKLMGGAGFVRKTVPVVDPATAGSDFGDWIPKDYR